MEVVEGGIYSLSGDAGFGGWFERRKEDICRQQLIIFLSSLIS
jgi:hypothetical protein